MIVRTWRGRVPAGKKQAYIDYLHRTGLTDYASTPGNLGVDLLCRDLGEVTEFLTVTRWESMEAIKRFAGPTPEKARYYPDDAQFLLEMEPFVTHHEVAYTSGR